MEMEVEVEMDENARMTGLLVRPYDESHQLIEECMVAANEAAIAVRILRIGGPYLLGAHNKWAVFFSGRGRSSLVREVYRWSTTRLMMSPSTCTAWTRMMMTITVMTMTSGSHRWKP